MRATDGYKFSRVFVDKFVFLTDDDDSRWAMGWVLVVVDVGWVCRWWGCISTDDYGWQGWSWEVGVGRRCWHEQGGGSESVEGDSGGAVVVMGER